MCAAARVCPRREYNAVPRFALSTSVSPCNELDLGDVELDFMHGVVVDNMRIDMPRAQHELNDDRAGRTVYFLRIKIFVVVDFFSTLTIYLI
jgi:hypothetical protein